MFSPANDAKHSAIDALDKEMSKVSLAAGEAADAANKAVADGKKVIDTTKGKTSLKKDLMQHCTTCFVQMFLSDAWSLASHWHNKMLCLRRRR